MGSVAQLKQSVMQQLLAHEDHVLVVVDPTQAGVVLPGYLMDARQPVGLNVGYGLALPIPDLTIDDHGLKGTLSFQRQPFHCTLPWTSLMQVTVGEEHLVWLTPSRNEAASRPEARHPGGAIVKASETVKAGETRDRPKLRLLK